MTTCAHLHCSFSYFLDNFISPHSMLDRICEMSTFSWRILFIRISSRRRKCTTKISRIICSIGQRKSTDTPCEVRWQTSAAMMSNVWKSIHSKGLTNREKSIPSQNYELLPRNKTQEEHCKGEPRSLMTAETIRKHLAYSHLKDLMRITKILSNRLNPDTLPPAQESRNLWKVIHYSSQISRTLLKYIRLGRHMKTVTERVMMLCRNKQVHRWNHAAHGKKHSCLCRKGAEPLMHMPLSVYR